jgi:hypothetical protein
MKTKKPFEKYDTLINELVKAHDTICLTYKVQQELNVPDDITNKLAFVVKTIKATLKDLEKLKNTEKFLWEDSLSQFSIV